MAEKEIRRRRGAERRLCAGSQEGRLGEFVFRGRSISLGSGSRIVGILNVTPDSFSDGGLFLDRKAAVGRAMEMLDGGADLVDVGGESTRPGAPPVDAGEECRRIVPVISDIRKLRPDAVISADTYKVSVARAALDAGADIINDISGLSLSEGMADLVAQKGAGLVLMHMKGTPATMAGLANYGNLLDEVASGLGEAARKARAAGVRAESIALDPGIGFAKTPEQSVEIISQIDFFRKLGHPLFAGPSRKSFIGHLLGGRAPSDRIWGTAGAVAWLVCRGVEFVRVHDVREMADLVKVLEALKRGNQ